MERLKIATVGSDNLTNTMFRVMGYDPITFTFELDLDDIHAVCFLGGSDVSPGLYGENLNPHTSCAPMRDEYEKTIYDYLDNSMPKLGICRGGQFLNVMNGGRLWQHCNGHYKTHTAFDVRNKFPLQVTSVHHQMMRPAQGAEILLTARCSEILETADTAFKTTEPDIECLIYKHTNSLCFQPHPEHGLTSCQNWFRDRIKQFFE